METAATRLSSPSRQPPSPARRRLRRVGAATICAMLSMGVAVESAASAATTPGAVTRSRTALAAAPQIAQYDVINITNRYRRQYGLSPVARSSALSSAAQGHANYMAATQVMTHTGAGGTNAGQRITAAGFYWRTWGENVAAGQTSPEQVMAAWMRSPGHRASILNRAFQFIGIGVAQGRNGALYWCMVLVGR